MALKAFFNWKSIRNSPQLTGIIYMSELKPEVYRFNLNNFTFTIRKIEQNFIIFSVKFRHLQGCRILK